MKIDDLQDGMTVTCRTGRAGRARVEWDGPWHQERLGVWRGKHTSVTVVTLKDRSWAEGSQDDLCDDPEGGIFVVEDWYLQIKDLIP